MATLSLLPAWLPMPHYFTIHQAIRVLTTLPAIEKYQAENRPAKTALENYLANLKAAVQKADSLIRR